MSKGTVNKVFLVGNLGNDPEGRVMPNGQSVANLSLATTESWKDAQGQLQEKTEWHRLTAYRGLADTITNHLIKGSKIYVEGKLVTRKWEDQGGNTRFSTEVEIVQLEMLGGNRRENSNNQQGGYQQGSNNNQQGGYQQDGNNNQQGGYQQNRSNNQQGGYQQNRSNNQNRPNNQQGGYQQNRSNNQNRPNNQQGGYQQNRSNNQNRPNNQQGGYQQNQDSHQRDMVTN
jgi:single-strand DNA-binding protein